MSYTKQCSVIVVMFLAFSGSVLSFCFYGTTTHCAFQCHCQPENTCVQFRNETSGGCQNRCSRHSASDQFLWEGEGCQWGNLALDAISAYQSGGNQRVPGRAIDGETSSVLTGQTYSFSARDNGGLLWYVRLGLNSSVIRHVTLYTVNTYENTVRGVGIYVSEVNHYTEENRCGTQSGSQSESTTFETTITCRQLMKGKWVFVVQDNIDVTELALAEVEVHGYEYYACHDHFDGDYWYGPGCLKRCNCQSQCNDVTGACPGDCADGYVQVSEQ